MKVSTVVPQKYFNGVSNTEETDEYLKLIKNNFREVGMVAFGQIKFLTDKEPKTENDYNWGTIDNLVRFANNNDIRLHYNTVINNKNSFPEWYWKLGSSSKKDFLKRHIKTVINRYKNDFYLFKLVNEQVRDKEDDFLGTGESRVKIVSQMFKWAKEESPESLFMINDFGNFFNKEIRAQYIKLVNDVKNAGGPIDIVGLQSHMWPFQLPTDDKIKLVLDEIHNMTSLPIYITEFDISYDDSINGGNKIDPNKPFKSKNGYEYKDWFEYQSFAYRHFFDICKSKKYVKGFTFWGFCDENVAWERPGIGLFEKNFKPKPVYYSLRNELSNSLNEIEGVVPIVDKLTQDT